MSSVYILSVVVSGVVINAIDCIRYYDEKQGKIAYMCVMPARIKEVYIVSLNSSHIIIIPQIDENEILLIIERMVKWQDETEN